jgi:hypothetical protein
LVSPQVNLGIARTVAQNRNLPPAEGIQPNTFANTRYFTFDFMLRVRPLRRSNVRPYLALGGGLVSFTPKDASGNNLDRQEGTRAPDENYNTTAFYYPLALGATFRLNDFAMLALQYKQYFTNTDYLDNIGQLGSRPGADQLQALSLSLCFSPGAKLRRGRLDN